MTKPTYHFGSPRPLNVAVDAYPDSLDWLPVADALRSVGLWIRNEADRSAWVSFYSPHVRYAARLADGWVCYQGPYRVLADGSLRGFEAFHQFTRQQYLGKLQAEGLSGFSNVASLSDPRFRARLRAIELPPEIPFSEDPNDYQLCWQDIHRIRKKSPFLFDSLATTAIQVDTRKVFYFMAAKDKRVLSPWPIAPGPNAHQEEKAAFIRAKNRWHSQMALYGESAGDLDPELALRRLLCEDLVYVLDEPWELKPAYRKDPAIRVAPLFFVKDPSILPPQFQGNWWFENIGDRFIGLEQQVAEGRYIEGTLFEENFRYTETQHRIRQHELWGHISAPGTDIPPISSSLYELFSSIQGRANGFFAEARKFANLRHPPVCLCCGAHIRKAIERAVGRSPDYCIECAAAERARERRWERHFERRRKPDKFKNRLDPLK